MTVKVTIVVRSMKNNVVSKKEKWSVFLEARGIRKQREDSTRPQS